jgi:hypothetical protein
MNNVPELGQAHHTRLYATTAPRFGPERFEALAFGRR